MFQSVLILLSGLGVFMLGMKLISTNLEALAGGKVEQLFARLNNSKFMSIGIGAGSAAVLQSSSATTMILMGFVNAGIVSLFQATCIIMGANIGTTITALVMSLNALPISEFFCLFTFVGMMIIIFARKTRVRAGGWVIAGTGMIFVGLRLITGSAASLNESEVVKGIFSSLSSPFILFMIGVLFTAIIQSSSATTGILLTLAQINIMPVISTLYVIMGANIGSCATAIFVSIGESLNARRAAMVNLLFNAAGAVLFMPIVIVFGKTACEFFTARFSPGAVIAYFQIIFNLSTVLIMIPFVKKLAELATILVNDGKKKRVPL